MPYRIIEIDISDPLPTILTSDNETGIAVLIRYNGIPIDFWLESFPANHVLASNYLSQKISEKTGVKLLSEKIKTELIPAIDRAQFPSLTVAICTKDRPEYLARCLKFLLPTQYSGISIPARLEILVIDNAPSNAQTKQLVASLPGIRYVCEPKPGLDFARNRALQEATGELVAFLDDDVTVDRHWLSGLMEAWAENPDAAGFTGLVLPYELATQAQIMFEQRGGFRRGFEKIRYHGQSLPGNPLYPCGAGIFGAGANMTFRREVIKKLGGFDEALDTGRPLPGGGDLDIFYRVIRAGYPLVYEPRYLVFHQHRREMKALRRQYWSWGLGFMAFVTKSYRIDPSQRAKLRRLIGWWFKDQLRHLRKSLMGRPHELPPHFVLAELWGGVVGLLGEYTRSLKRIERIRRQFA